jgi:hypothetical protein
MLAAWIKLYRLEVEHTINCCHDESNLHCVRGTGEMGVDLLSLVLVDRDEAVQDVVACCSIIWAALVIGEVVLLRANR